MRRIEIASEIDLALLYANSVGYGNGKEKDSCGID